MFYTANADTRLMGKQVPFIHTVFLSTCCLRRGWSMKVFCVPAFLEGESEHYVQSWSLPLIKACLRFPWDSRPNVINAKKATCVHKMPH